MIDSSGIGTYLRNLISQLPGISKNEYVLFGNSQKLARYGLPVVEANFSVYGLKEQMLFPKVLSKAKLDLLHCPHYAVPIGYSRKMAVTIHDLIHWLFPRYVRSRFGFIYARFMLKHAANKATRIIAVSENTKSDIVKILSIPRDKIRVVYNGVEEKFRPSLEVGDRMKRAYGKYVLYTGLIKPHKNIIGLINAFYRLKKDAGIEHRLILIGEEKQPYGKQVRKMIENLCLQKEVLLLGNICSEELIGFYNGADVFVLPSFYEGFGLPPLEAMACGCPVVTSNNSSLPETVGDAGIMVDAHNIDSLAGAIHSLLSNESLRQRMIKKGLERVRLFSWEKTARETLKVYEEVLQ